MKGVMIFRSLPCILVPSRGLVPGHAIRVLKSGAEEISVSSYVPQNTGNGKDSAVGTSWKLHTCCQNM